jgi:hypothetical protein
LSSVGLRGIHCGGQRKISPMFCREPESIQTNGATKITPPTMRMA